MKKQFSKIAVVGMDGVFPQAFDTDQFFDNIIHKRSAIIKVPSHRWIAPPDAVYADVPAPDKVVSKKAGLIEKFTFKPDNFHIDPELLAKLDPVHQLTLHAGKNAFAQCHATHQEKKRTGVILAAIALPTDESSHFSWQMICRPGSFHPKPFDATRTRMVSLPAALLARELGVEGGCFTLDAACASSLYAIKLACEYLQRKKTDMMIAGGVSRPDALYTQIGFSQLQALSPTGKCAPFDQNADGLVVGEGIGIVVLKRLEDAIACQDHIYAVITGAGASNDIDGTLVGPSSEGQVRAMVAAFNQAKWTPEQIQYMECHGSGTKIGDETELKSIKTLLDIFHQPDTRISIGSIKSMIGHLLTAAGAAGFIKTILFMNKKTLPPSLNFYSPQKNSILNQSKICVQTEPEPWIPKNTRSTRKAGISAFGFGGINAHLLVEEFSNKAKHPFVPNLPGEKIQTMIPCAIVGMETIAHDCDSITEFTDIVSGKKTIFPSSPKPRWRTDKNNLAEHPGYFIENFQMDTGEFHIPPNQLDDILPQHLILLKTAKGALIDAAISPRPAVDKKERTRMGCIIGIDFDYGATDFHLRWRNYSLDESIKEKISPPLTFNRTLGALGGIAASRVAREFKFGGPCFTISSGDTSGVNAVSIAVNSLNNHETDVVLCGCIDLAGDLRPYALHSCGMKGETSLCGEGAAAIVIKRLENALADNDKIYAVIKGIGSASGGAIPGESIVSEDHSQRLYARSFNRALVAADLQAHHIDLYEMAWSGRKKENQVEIDSVKKFFNLPGNHFSFNPRQILATPGIIGHTKTASSLFSIIKCALCIDHDKLPLEKDFHLEPAKSFQGVFNIPEHPDKGGTDPGKTACIASISAEGGVSHLILQKLTQKRKSDLSEKKTIDTHILKNKQTGYTIHTNPRPLSKEILSLIHPSNNEDNKQMNQSNAIAEGLDPLLFAACTHKTSQAHERFLEFSKNNLAEMEQQFSAFAQVSAAIVHENPLSENKDGLFNTKPSAPFKTKTENDLHQTLFDREQCLEFATGKAGNVLGEPFDIIDTYPVRVRLPDEPLMLVDRIIEIQGEMLSLSSGKIVTQHDVKQGAWYLDGGKVPVSISIEAGQADLFLCAYLGIDHIVKGSRKYRLLDAKTRFHRTLPEPGDTIEYHIEIERFLKQGDVYLFFFKYNGYIDNTLFISMRDGCAGFFTEEEVKNSGGIILKNKNTTKIDIHNGFRPLVQTSKTQFSDNKINALRSGDLVPAFGNLFAGKKLGKNLILPGNRMHLIDRVLEFDPCGGRYGFGAITAQADIHPDAWFLTCHFIDDRVMPGTLMYECCAHTLRVFTQRMGWISNRDDVYYDIIVNNESDLKCRGPVTPETRTARYEIEVKEMGYNPEPYVIADAHMFSDDLRIVLYKNMGMKIAGLTEPELKSLWRKV